MDNSLSVCALYIGHRLLVLWHLMDTVCNTSHHDKCGCNIDLSQIKTVAVEPLWYRRKVREALEIRRLQTGPNEQTGINRDLGDYVTTNAWKPLFTKINKDKHTLTFKKMTPNHNTESNETNAALQCGNNRVRNNVTSLSVST